MVLGFHQFSDPQKESHDVLRFSHHGQNSQTRSTNIGPSLAGVVLVPCPCRMAATSPSWLNAGPAPVPRWTWFRWVVSPFSLGDSSMKIQENPRKSNGQNQHRKSTAAIFEDFDDFFHQLELKWVGKLWVSATKRRNIVKNG